MKKNKGVFSIAAFKYAFEGILSFIKLEKHAKIHLLATLVVMVLGFILKINKIEWALLILVIALVFVAEMINTAIEKSCDLIDPKINPKIKQIKDLAAGAVLLASIFAIVIGILVFLPKIL